MVRNQRDEPEFEFSGANWVSDFNFDCNTATTVGDALGTYFDELIDRGRITGTMSA